MPTRHEAHSPLKVALAVQAGYVSVSLLAEGKEGTLLENLERSCETRSMGPQRCGARRASR
jgi:hypothetical protein